MKLAAVSAVSALLVSAVLQTALVEAGARIEVRFVYYHNPDGKAADGSNCDLTTPCDPLFTITVHLPDGSSPQVTTDRASDQNSVTFGDKIVNIDNPLVYTQAKYSGYFTIQVKVDDYDPVGAWDYIGTFSYTHHATAVPNAGLPVVVQRFLKDDGASKATLALQISVTCQANYYGADCTRLCVPANDDVAGHYSCDASGNVVCLPTYHPASGCRQTYCSLLSPCQNGGHCSNVDAGFVCECVGLWTDATCSTATSVCESGTPCRNNGTCTRGTGTSGCVCQAGFSGSFCEADVDECAAAGSAPPACEHAISCQNQFGTYSCRCQSGWTGRACSQDVDECSNSSAVVCLNSGRCVNQPGSFSCDCASGFRGARCQADIDECAEDPAANASCRLHEFCQNLQGSFTCLCRPGFGGLNCSMQYLTQQEADAAATSKLLAGVLVPTLLLLLALALAVTAGYCLWRRHRLGWLRRRLGLRERQPTPTPPTYDLPRAASSAFTENATYSNGARNSDVYYSGGGEGDYAKIRLPGPHDYGYASVGREPPPSGAAPPLPPKRTEPQSQQSQQAQQQQQQQQQQSTGGPYSLMSEAASAGSLQVADAVYNGGDYSNAREEGVGGEGGSSGDCAGGSAVAMGTAI